MTETYYICENAGILTDDYDEADICLDCWRKVKKEHEELGISSDLAVEVIKYFQDERNQQ